VEIGEEKLVFRVEEGYAFCGWGDSLRIGEGGGGGD